LWSSIAISANRVLIAIVWDSKSWWLPWVWVVGVVLGLEVSRLARSSSDWHRLLEICALTDTLILDEDGLYNPGHFNDRFAAGSQRDHE
jgi:hypothetical protein